MLKNGGDKYHDLSSDAKGPVRPMSIILHETPCLRIRDTNDLALTYRLKRPKALLYEIEDGGPQCPI